MNKKGDTVKPRNTRNVYPTSQAEQEGETMSFIEWMTRSRLARIKGKRILCSVCGKAVSTLVPGTTLVRAWIECPVCIIKEKEDEDETWLQRL